MDGVLVRNPLVPDDVFNSAADEDGDGLRDYYFTKRMSDFGNRGNNAKRDTFRVVGGLEGAFASDRWHYEGFYSFGQTKEAQTGERPGQRAELPQRARSHSGRRRRRR